ncbi:nuclease-related domain-containing protein [Clostridium butyricum]|uniref:nuclease-related domain-containing protein n=1 Tax=Clostridium butyricum TaxID=1492 RepID=UPI00374E28D4
MEGLFIIFLVCYISLYIKRRRYEKSNYKNESGNTYSDIQSNKGMIGEQLIFNELEKIKGVHKILANVYLPKGNGHTSEVDIIYINESGIYVIESKNYKGYIYGNEQDKYWRQKLANSIEFYNPILQNSAHIDAIIKNLNIDRKCIKSVIVFGNECKLCNSKILSQDVYVIKRKKLIKLLKSLMKKSINKFDEDKINCMYNQLRRYSCVDDCVKLMHIENIKRKIK